MWKRIILCALALLLTAAANLKVSCSVAVDGRKLPGSYSPACADACMRVSRLAAEEICLNTPEMPVMTTRTFLSLKPARNDRQALTDAVLRETQGVSVLKAVYVKDTRLGTVSEDCDIRAMLRQNIVSQQPNSAVYGIYSGEIVLDLCYGRTGSETDSADMVLLVSGMAPVMYYDSNGERA